MLIQLVTRFSYGMFLGIYLCAWVLIECDSAFSSNIVHMYIFLCMSGHILNIRSVLDCRWIKKNICIAYPADPSMLLYILLCSLLWYFAYLFCFPLTISEHFCLLAASNAIGLVLFVHLLTASFFWPDFTPACNISSHVCIWSYVISCCFLLCIVWQLYTHLCIMISLFWLEPAYMLFSQCTCICKLQHI